MRLLTAIGVFMLSLFLMLLGVFLRVPPVTNSAAVQLDTVYNFTFIPNSVLTRYEGTPKVTVSGADHAFLATGRDTDVLSWIDKTSFNTVDFDKKTKLVSVSSFGSGPNASPMGSDLWRSSTGLTTEKSATLKVDPSDSAGVLVASNGFSPAPNDIRITWLVKHDLLPSNILLIIGFVALLIALVLNFLAYRDMRSRRGPSRKVPKAPQGPRSRVKNPRISPNKGRRAARKVAVAIPAGILSLTLLTGCTTASTSIPTPTPTETGALNYPPVVVRAQLDRILEEIASVAADADKSRSNADLAIRFAGPAYDTRSAHYVLERANKKTPSLPAISAKPITFNLPEATIGFDQPRIVMVVTETKVKGKPAIPQMLVLRQDNARSNYKLWYTIQLLSGALIPSSAAAEVGAIPVDKEAKYLAVSPVSIPRAYGDVIDNMTASKFAPIFDLSDDVYYNEASSYQEKQTVSLKNGKITFKHTLGNKEPMGLATMDGGALIAVYMIDAYKIKPTKSGSAITVSGDEKIMLGANGSVTGLSTKYGVMLLMYVPTGGSEKKAKVLGYTHQLLSVVTL